VAGGALDTFVTGYGPASARGEASAPPPSPAEAPTDTAPAPPSPAAIPDGLAISPAARETAQRQQVDLRTLLGSGRGGRIPLQDVVQAARPPAPIPAPVALDIAPTPADPRVHASPLAIRIAAQHGIPLVGMVGTGARGRICKADVIARLPSALTQPELAPAAPSVAAAAIATPTASSTPAVTVIPMSPMRKAIARQLSLSKSTIPHFYVRNAARLDRLIELRKAAKRATGEAPSINDYIIRACALALVTYPDVNVQVHDDTIHRFAHADISIAVATEKGLITPILRAAEGRSVLAIAGESKALAARARAGKLTPDEYQGGSFSISNLGMFGIDQFDAIINPPQGAILAVGATRQEALATDHALTFATRVQLSASFDHRAIDGALGAQFLAEVTRLLENPEDLTA